MIGPTLPPLQPHAHLLLPRHHPRTSLHLGIPLSTCHSRSDRHEALDSGLPPILKTLRRQSLSHPQNHRRCRDRPARDRRSDSSARKNPQSIFHTLLPLRLRANLHVHPRDRTLVLRRPGYRPSTLHIRHPNRGCNGPLYTRAGRHDIRLEIFELGGMDCARSDERSEGGGGNKRGNRCDKRQQIPSVGRDDGCFRDDWGLWYVSHLGGIFGSMEKMSIREVPFAIMVDLWDTHIWEVRLPNNSRRLAFRLARKASFNGSDNH